MPNGEYGPRPEEVIPKEEKRGETAEEYYGDQREKIESSQRAIEDLERQRKIIVEAIAKEKDPEELQELVEEDGKLLAELERLQLKFKEAEIAIKTATELGIEVPPEPIEIDVSQLESAESEAKKEFADIAEINELVEQRNNLMEQLKKEEDPTRIDEIVDNVVILNQEINNILERDSSQARKISAIERLRKVAA